MMQTPTRIGGLPGNSRTIAMILMRWLAPILLLVNSLAHAQLVPYITRDEFDWKTWESVENEEAKKELIARIQDLEDFSRIMAPIEERSKHFKVIDIDADGFPDLVYNGPQGSDKQAVMIYKNNQGVFKKIFHQTGDLIYISRDKPWNPISFQIIQKVADENSELQICSHSFQNGQLQFVLDNTIIIRDGMKVMKENLPPMLFEVENTQVTLYATPGIEGTTSIQDYGDGAIGFAVGSLINSKEEIWWFVLMKEEQNKLRAGWINRDSNPGNIRFIREFR